MKSFTAIFLALVVVAFACGDDAIKGGYVPEEGFVPNEDVAIKIAVAVWEPIYGADHIATEKPYRATLDKGVWSIRGSLPKAKKGGTVKGGVAEAKISKADGRILQVCHGK
jgi:hypothetical protein